MKRRRQPRPKARPDEESSQSSELADESPAREIVAGFVPAGFVAIAIWASHRPADATALTQGAAVNLTWATLVWIAMSAWIHSWLNRSRIQIDERDHKHRDPVFASLDRVLNGLILAVPICLGVSAALWSRTHPEGTNIEAASNVAWWWIACGGSVVTLRRCFQRGSRWRRPILVWLWMIGTLLSVLAIHQHFISLPQSLRDFQVDPEGTLAILGIQAPAGSATRMIFENRLRDGGSTATFALANTLSGVLAISLTTMIVWVVHQSRDGYRNDCADDNPSHRSGWPDRSSSRVLLKCAWLVWITLLSVAIWTTYSRGAAGAVVLSVIALAITSLVKSAWTRRTRHLSGAGNVIALQVAVAASGLVVGFVLLGILGQQLRPYVPASLAFRFQYWASSLRMTAEFPWLGIGPGQFQTIYQSYRDLDAHETIADPHHFWFEILTSGGWITGCLTAGLIALSFVMARQVTGDHDRRSTVRRPRAGLGWVVGLFGGLAWILIWGHAIATRQVFDIDGMLLAVPVAALCGWLAHVSLGHHELNDSEIVDRTTELATWGLLAAMIHLSLAGGVSVPGVSVWLIALIALATAGRPSMTSPEAKLVDPKPDRFIKRTYSNRGWLRHPWSALGWTGLVLLMSWQSWWPHRHVEGLIAEAELALQRGSTATAVQSLTRGLDSNPHAVKPAAWLTQTLYREQVNQAILPAVSPSLTSASRQWRQRSGNDPAVDSQLGEQRLHRYQIAGDADDLAQAWSHFFAAIQASPNQQTYLAQAAEIARELDRLHLPLGKNLSLGESPLARRGSLPRSDATWTQLFSSISLAKSWSSVAGELANRSRIAAEAGNVVTRQLSLQMIMPAQKIGSIARPNPVRRSADEVLAKSEL
ncbi:MAG: O-antigen ligase family protein [Planctomycetota bacterium]